MSDKEKIPTYWQIQHWVSPENAIGDKGYWLPVRIEYGGKQDIYDESEALELFDENKRHWDRGSLRLVKIVSHVIKHH